MTEIANLMKQLGENVQGYQIRDMVKEVDINEDKMVNIDEFEAVSCTTLGGRKGGGM